MVISEPMCEKDSAALEVDCLTQESSRDPKLLWDTSSERRGFPLSLRNARAED